MKVPFLDLKKQYNNISEEISKAISNVIENTAFILGKQVSDFENEFASFCTTKYALGLGNGTDAVKFALLAAGVKPGDEVITAPNTFIATTEVIPQIGAKVVFADIDEKTYNLNHSEIEKAISPKTKVIMPIHLYGQCADMDEIIKIGKNYNLQVVEDACQAHGAEYKGKKAGSMGVASAFSFYPGKNLGAFGDAGALVTNSQEISDYVKLLRNHGQIEKNVHQIEGYNSRLDTLQAAILNVKLKYLNEWNEKRRENALYYNQLLKETSVITPFEPEWSKAVYHLYVIRIKDRDLLIEKLLEAGIDTGLHYPTPLHLQDACKYLGYKKGDFPIAEKVTDEIISLPMYPELTKEQIEYVAENIIKFTKG